MNVRLILAILVSLIDEAIIVALILWGLPRLGINIPLPWLIVILVLLAIYAVFSFRIGSRILRKKPVPGLSSMVGMRGKAINSLSPEGLVRIGGEIWKARADSGEISADAEIEVVGQEGLSLVVHERR
jgi:membrane-bound ClpP family serine protease